MNPKVGFSNHFNFDERSILIDSLDLAEVILGMACIPYYSLPLEGLTMDK